VKSLIEILRERLDIKEEEYREWLIERGAVFPKFAKNFKGFLENRAISQETE
jgi:hypothetical protein